ncbi:M91 family zinc metallopeptidase [Nostoc sp. UHCC 0302]|uniref:M91 family zinc metallopeptidase n=1 Tax=Nostoc sp. UHCC 0302 TaxID=3134896 RepID=UPI00311CC2D6
MNLQKIKYPRSENTNLKRGCKMKFSTTRLSTASNPKTSENTSSLAPQFSSIPPTNATRGHKLVEDIENDAFAKQQMETSKLELQAKYGMITPEGQECLTVLQTKMDGLLNARLQRATRRAHNFANIPIRRPDTPTSIQAKLTIGESGDKYEQVVQQIHQSQSNKLQREALPEEDELQMKSAVPNSKRYIPTLKNQEKIQLVEFKKNKLQQEKTRYQRLQEIFIVKGIKLETPIHFNIPAMKQGLDSINELIEKGLESVEQELSIREKNWFARKNKIKKLRQGNELYGGVDEHKVANIDLEAISQGLDAIEKELVTTKTEAIDEYNQVASDVTNNDKKQPTVNITAEIKGDEIVVGNNIKIKSTYFAETIDRPNDELQINLLTIVRKIIQTPIGFKLISELVNSKKDVDIFLTSPSRKNGSSQRSIDAAGTGHGAKKGKPSQDPNHRGTGLPSRSQVFFDPDQQLDLSTKDPSKQPANISSTPTYNVPDDAKLFHELTHALHAAHGEQDVTQLKQRNSNDLYTLGAWNNQEEKNTVKDETEYLKQIGFPVRRIMYGKLGGRIDK